jgi:hypothetical protein
VYSLCSLRLGSFLTTEDAEVNNRGHGAGSMITLCVLCVFSVFSAVMFFNHRVHSGFSLLTLRFLCVLCGYGCFLPQRTLRLTAEGTGLSLCSLCVLCVLCGYCIFYHRRHIVFIRLIPIPFAVCYEPFTIGLNHIPYLSK